RLEPLNLRQLRLGRLVTETDRLVGAMEFSQAYMAELRLQRQVRRIAGQPRTRDAVLNDVEGFDHDACDADPRFAIARPLVHEKGDFLANEMPVFLLGEVGAVLDDRGATE